MNGWIAFGLLTGVTLHMMYPQRRKSGALGALLLGTFGAVVGGFLAN